MLPGILERQPDLPLSETAHILNFTQVSDRMSKSEIVTRGWRFEVESVSGRILLEAVEEIHGLIGIPFDKFLQTDNNFAHSFCYKL